MPYDMVAFYKSAALTTPTAITPCADQIYPAIGTDYVTPTVYAPWLAGVWYAGTTTPKFVEAYQPKFTPAHRFYKSQILGTKNPIIGFTDHTHRPIGLYPGEQFTLRGQNATNEANLACAVFSSGPWKCTEQEAVRPTHFLTGYSDTTLTAGVWNSCTVTWDQLLPYGRYAIVGFRAGLYKAATPAPGIARIVLPDSQWRPGCLASIMDGDKTLVNSAEGFGSDPFAALPLMKEISFTNLAMPQSFEVASLAADTDEVFELSLVKIA